MTMTVNMCLLQFGRPVFLHSRSYRLTDTLKPCSSALVSQHSHKSLDTRCLFVAGRCVSDTSSNSLEPVLGYEFVSEPNQMIEQKKFSIVKLLELSNVLLPHAILGSTLLAIVFPPSFQWFTSRYYAPALGFLMFAVGINARGKDFFKVCHRFPVILAGFVGQFVIKPFLGYLLGKLSSSLFGLPTSIGAGIMLVSCVSGAQLSTYATFLTDPQMAPLSMAMTSLSTFSAVIVTPLLSLLLIGKKLPVDLKGMVSSILQIVVLPITGGLLMNRFLPQISGAIQQIMPPLSLLVTACCVGAPLAINIKSVMSPFGLITTLLIVVFHMSAFFLGYVLSGLIFESSSDSKELQRTISFETGMQSSLLALALANRFFQDPLVAVPPAISTVIMAIMGFLLATMWSKKKKKLAT